MANNLKINDLPHLDVVDDVKSNQLIAGTGPTVGLTLGVIFVPRITLTSIEAVSALILAGGGSINGSVVPFASFAVTL